VPAIDGGAVALSLPCVHDCAIADDAIMETKTENMTCFIELASASLLQKLCRSLPLRARVCNLQTRLRTVFLVLERSTRCHYLLDRKRRLGGGGDSSYQSLQMRSFPPIPCLRQSGGQAIPQERRRRGQRLRDGLSLIVLVVPLNPFKGAAPRRVIP
jgi:hypothetical protein